MERLNVQGFINEMSYGMNLEESENLFFKYQDTIIDYVVKNAYSFKERKQLFELCEVLRSEKFMNLMHMIVFGDDDKIKPDMAYVLHVATNYRFVDDELKAKALELGYHLREAELGTVVKHKATNISIIIASTKAPRGYELTPHIRTKCVENIIRTLPEVLYNAYHEEFKATDITRNVILAIITNAVLDVKPAEIITAFCKSEFPKDVEDGVKTFALRLRAFFYEIAGVVGDELLSKILIGACESIRKFNDKFGKNETFTDKYLNFILLEKVCKSLNKEKVNTPQSNNMKKSYNAIKKFATNNKKYEELFYGGLK